MSTIDTRSIIDQIIRNGGYYDLEDKGAPDNPQATKIVEYTNAWGHVTWGVVFETDSASHDRYEIASEFILNPIVIWRR